MKAALLTAIRQFEIRQVPEPEIVMVKVKSDSRQSVLANLLVCAIMSV